MKPDFEVSENSIKIVLPLFEKDANLTEDEKVMRNVEIDGNKGYREACFVGRGRAAE